MEQRKKWIGTLDLPFTVIKPMMNISVHTFRFIASDNGRGFIVNILMKRDLPFVWIACSVGLKWY